MRRVSSGTLVGVGITAAVAGVSFVGITANLPLGVTLLVVGALCFGGAIREWCRGEELDQPHVLAQFKLPGALIVQNQGAPATDVRIESITTGDYVSRYLENFKVPGRGTVSGAIITKAMTAEFGVVSDLHDSSPRPVPTTVRDSTLGSLRIEPDLTLQDFLMASLDRRKTEELQHLQDRAGDPMKAAELDAAAAHLRRPLEVHLRLTYRDRQGQRQWEQQERLRYDPDKDYAHVVHVKRRRLLGSGAWGR